MERKRFSLELSEGLLNKIDQFKREWGLRSRGAIVERLLTEGARTAGDLADVAPISAPASNTIGVSPRCRR